MTPELYLAMFAANFFVVFLLGVQSRNVNAGRYMAAVLTSAGINTSQFLFVKFASTGGWSTWAVTTIAGCTGIASAIWFYQNVMAKRKPAAGDDEVDADVPAPSVVLPKDWEPVRIDRMPDPFEVKIVPLPLIIRNADRNEDLVYAPPR